MSDHFDAANLLTDITDLYVFPAASPDRTVLVLNVNPEASSRDVNFDPAASYELKLDTDGDSLPDIAFHVLFASSGGESTATVYRATGGAALGTGRVGEAVIRDARIAPNGDARFARGNGCEFFAGLRSDPFFKDIEGFGNDFQFTGHDPVAERNVFGIVLEVPNDALGSGRPVRLWGRTMALVHGRVVQIDQAGRPGVNGAFNLDEADNEAFCRSSPADQRAAFGDKFVRFLRSLGYDETAAMDLGLSFLPDWLVYNPGEPAGYPNGRRLTDDVADLLAALLTKGRITSDGVGPHTDLLDVFPYLGPPRPDRKPERR